MAPVHEVPKDKVRRMIPNRSLTVPVKGKGVGRRCNRVPVSKTEAYISNLKDGEQVDEPSARSQGQAGTRTGEASFAACCDERADKT